MSPDPVARVLDASTEVARSDMYRLEVLGQMADRRRLKSVDQKQVILAQADHRDIAGALSQQYDRLH